MSTDSKVREEITITWRIENYSWCHQKPGECFMSPAFTVESIPGSLWSLGFYPRGLSTTNRYIGCMLLRGDESILINEMSNEKIDLISADGSILESKKMEKVRGLFGITITDTKIMDLDDLAKKLANCKEDTLIIRYYCTGRETRETTDTRYEIKTRFGVDRRSFHWNVANFNSKDWVESKIFVFLMTKTQIDITLTAPEDIVLFSIRRTEEENLTLSRFATCRVSLLDVERVERHSKKYTHFFEIKDGIPIITEQTWEFSSSITKTQLNEEGHAFLKNGTFTLMCEFSISNGSSESEIHNVSDISYSMNILSLTDTFSPLRENLRSMYTNKKHSDVKLQVQGDVCLAHKSLLAARSPVFSTMFDQDMLETQTGVVDIPDMDAETLKSFLSFVYTGTVDTMDCEGTLKLLLAADKYQVESLKEKCASFLLSDLSEGNACEVLAIADMVGHKLLKESVQDYIKTHADKILSSPEWSQWIEKNVRLASEILSKLSIEFRSLADKVSIHPKYDISSALNVVSPMDVFSSLKENLRNLFTNKKHSDVKLKVGGDIFPAHKSFLTVRSPVFSTMFDQDMLENQTGIVDIPDMDAETMNSFLSFVYTGTLDKNDYEGTLKLLLAADKYQVESLKEKCASILTSCLSDENACEVLVLADMVEHKLLKEFVQEYIKTHAKKILPSPEWSQWIEKNVRLASEILSKLSLQLGR